jgi:hypothetical protein
VTPYKSLFSSKGTECAYYPKFNSWASRFLDWQHFMWYVECRAEKPWDLDVLSMIGQEQAGWFRYLRASPPHHGKTVPYSKTKIIEIITKAIPHRTGQCAKAAPWFGFCTRNESICFYWPEYESKIHVMVSFQHMLRVKIAATIGMCSQFVWRCAYLRSLSREQRRSHHWYGDHEHNGFSR